MFSPAHSQSIASSSRELKTAESAVVCQFESEHDSLSGRSTFSSFIRWPHPSLAVFRRAT
jgi:hypothetical protein